MLLRFKGLTVDTHKEVVGSLTEAYSRSSQYFEIAPHIHYRIEDGNGRRPSFSTVEVIPESVEAIDANISVIAENISGKIFSLPQAIEIAWALKEELKIKKEDFK